MSQLFYTTGEEVRLGDIVEMDGRMGKIVACIESGQFSAGLPENNWAYLKTGVLWEGTELGLVHIPSLSDPDLIFIRCKHEGD